MTKKEAPLQTVWGQYIRALSLPWYGYFELKQTDKKTFPFSELEKSQEEGLPATEANGLYWKYSDQDQRRKPCDCSHTPPLPSYVVIAFSKVFYAIRIGHIVEMMEQGKKHITLSEAKELSEKIIRNIS